MRFCALYSGSSGNSLFLEAGGVRLLVDAGVAGRAVGSALGQIGVSPDTIGAILVTHEHIDHIKGVGVLSRRYNIPVYANAKTWEAMQEQVGTIAPSCTRIFETDRDFYIKGLNVLPFKTPHDAAESVGFVFNCRGARISTMTDVGHITGRLLSAVSDSDLLFIEANHDVDMLRAGSYPYLLKRRIFGDNGHLSNEAAGKAVVKLFGQRMRNVMLGHLSRENNMEELALETVRCELRAQDIPDGEIAVSVAHRDRISELFNIEE